MISSRTILACACLCSLLANLGCASFWHDLKPSRLHRLNRGPAPSLDPEFSQNEHHPSTQFVNHLKTPKSSRISANTAEVASIRAQSPEM